MNVGRQGRRTLHLSNAPAAVLFRFVMKALVFENRLLRAAATKLLGALSPRFYVSRLAPITLTEIPDAALTRPDWVLLFDFSASPAGCSFTAFAAGGLG